MAQRVGNETPGGTSTNYQLCDSSSKYNYSSRGKSKESIYQRKSHHKSLTKEIDFGNSFTDPQFHNIKMGELSHVEDGLIKNSPLRSFVTRHLPKSSERYNTESTSKLKSNNLSKINLAIVTKRRKSRSRK